MNKKFDAVAYQRKAREELTKKYLSNPEKFMQELKEKYRDHHKSKFHQIESQAV